MENYFSAELIWFVIGIVFLLLELFIPGLVIIFFGAGALTTALVCLIYTPDLLTQLLIFTASSLFFLILLRKNLKKKFFDKKDWEKVTLEEEFIGKDAIATKTFGGEKPGYVEFKGTVWEAFSEFDIVKDQKVRIIKKESIKLYVVPLNVDRV